MMPALPLPASVRALIWWGLIALALGCVIRADVRQVRAVLELSESGSPPPARASHSPTGYVLGQRQVLGRQEKGETYRWVATAQELLATGSVRATYAEDTIPTGRPNLQPRLYAGWLATVAWGVGLVTRESAGPAVEQAAVWEPVLAHVLIFLAAVGFVARRHGPALAAAAAVFLALYPPFFAQFLPGVLTARVWALFFAAAAILPCLRPAENGSRARAADVAGPGLAIPGALALWLDPAAGFPALLIVALAAGAALLPGRAEPARFLPWSAVGALLTLAAWWIDGAVWSLKAGELRYVHPLYAAAWLGLGLVLDGVQGLRSAPNRRRWRIVEVIGGVSLVLSLVYPQLKHGYLGWVYPSLWMRRFTALDTTPGFAHAGEWLEHASATEVLLISAPGLAGLAVLARAFARAASGGISREERQARPSSGRAVNDDAKPRVAAGSPPSRAALVAMAVLLAGLFVLACFRLRWTTVVAVAGGCTALWLVPTLGQALRRTAAGLGALLLVALLAWQASLPATLARPMQRLEPDAADLENLVYRHLSHWLAAHSPSNRLSVLAPPEASDAIVFHGGGRALVSTAWESYPGQLAARRILSAPEWTEVESVVQGHELTHVILPSWDQVLPRFVQAPVEPGKEAALDRLRRWVLPPFLRPLPYRLPPLPAFAGEQLIVLQVTAPQEEPLLLSRLAEYFVEMEREEPAMLVARVLADSYPDEPEAMTARALVHAQRKEQAELNRELDRLAKAVNAGQHPPSWDRRVQRAIVLALGRRRDLVRQEVEACVGTATEADVFELTPLQAYRLLVLAKGQGVSFPSSELRDLAARLAADYGTP